MADRSFARILAPLALVAAAAGIVIVVGASSKDKPSGTHAASAAHHRHHRAKPRPHYYVVRTGDNLTIIATRTGVSIDTLQRLNANVDPQALHIGERLKLTP